MPTQLNLALEWFLNPDHTPLAIGLEKGWFRDAGIDLCLIQPEEHLDAPEQIATGEIDFAITEPLHLVADRALGRPLVGFGRFLHTNGGMMVLEKSGITRPADLVGKRIQYPGAPGPGGLAIATTMARADGAQCTPSDFIPVNNGFEHTNALDTNIADAATLVFYNFEVIEAEERGLKPTYFPLKTYGVPDFCQLHFIGDEERVKRDEPLVRAFLAVVRRGIDFIHEHPDEAWHLYKKYAQQEQSNRLSDRIYQATIGCFCHDLSMSNLYWTRLVEWMVETKQIKAPIDIAPCFNNHLAF